MFLGNAMRDYSKIARGCAGSTLESLNSTVQSVLEELETSAATPLIRALRLVNYQKAIFAVGLFSMFEAHLGLKDGFKGVSRILGKHGEVELKVRFEQFNCAINVLKHGRGSSYDKLVQSTSPLPFKILRPGEFFFDEGDVSEISTDIEVNDNFINNCLDVINKVSTIINKRS